ncbi:hypothetical protein EV03_1312 [Prochlorococcus marinus str. PAC1]|uniref:Uncharacterized protein n=1 Tax=Prochlorococcus marinus str. PAC1 TaxID=59924 RepID=A0A0A2C621_PROMR|nr:hypothetical protein EV03_1312 [Prochlorococcus marinus str. PAC1]
MLFCEWTDPDGYVSECLWDLLGTYIPLAYQVCLSRDRL